MLSIQDVGVQILGENPGPFYILGGSEYGIKEKYIAHLQQHYGEKVEAESMSSIVDMMSRKHIIPLTPAVYVVRYDEGFIATCDTLSKKISSLKVPGTIICIYESSKHISKLDKVFPNNTCMIESVNAKFIAKYLHSDFPQVDDRSIKIAVNSSTNYSQAKRMCNSMSFAEPDSLARLPEGEVAKMFGHVDYSTESQIQLGVASRNFKYLDEMTDKFSEDPSRLLYLILQTMIELEKLLGVKYSDSPLKQYMKLWTPQDIYYMFMNTYSELQKSRSSSGYNIQNSLTYLFGLLRFQRIPSEEVMNSEL